MNTMIVNFIPFIFFILVICISVVSSKFRIFKSKYSKLHKCSIIFLLIGFIVMAIFGISILINNSGKAKSSSYQRSSADGFTIEKFKIEMFVKENNTVDVNEYITVNFYEQGHHGIYRFIPSWLEYTNKDGITQSRKYKLSNLRADGDNYTLDTVNGKKRIKIGDANYTLPVGDHTYSIKYTYDMGFDPYEGYDEFIFHAFGDYWGTEIKGASLIVHFPKSFDLKNNIKFFEDKYRRKDITSEVDYYMEDNILYANLSPTHNLSSALTIDVELPEKYFENINNTYGSNSLILCIFCILISVVAICLWLINGKDLDKVPETVEFYPPNKLDAAEIGYLYKRDTGKKLAVSIIVELASKGFIKIIESDDKKTQTIVKTSITDFNKYINREIKVVKLKEYKTPFFDTHYNATKIMVDNLPEKVNKYTVTSDFDKFLEDSKYLVDKGYIKIESDTIDKYSKEDIEKITKELEENEFKDKPKMTENEKIVYDRLFADGDETELATNHSFYRSFDEIAEKVSSKFDDKINDLTAYRFMLISSLFFILSVFSWGSAYCIFEDLNPKLNYLYTLAFISNFVIFIFTILMKRKNSYGEKITAKINGFKKYIELAEKKQIELLVEENPNYFYDILPYAYVLDVSKKWVEKFEKIPTPTTDMGNFDYISTSSIDSLSDSIYVYSSSSSSSSGCGGGCSSCGGGCSSCGGGGGW